MRGWSRHLEASKVAFDYRAMLAAIPFKEDVLVLAWSLLGASSWILGGHGPGRQVATSGSAD